MKLKKRHIRYIVLGILLILVISARFFPSLGEWYAQYLYPSISTVLSSFSSLFPFSLGDIFIFLSIAGVIVYPLVSWWSKKPWKRTLAHVVEYLLWVYVWFYMAWGLNYFRDSFYTRAQVTPVAYSADNFNTFLDKYIENLNNTYIPVEWVEKHIVEQEIKENYNKIYQSFGMTRPRGWQRVKTMLFTPLMSKVGVSGYMGPFFCEFHLSGDLLPSQYPSTYAHEMAHLLGITSEAEANLYAYMVCISSRNPQIRFSGYFSLFSHVLANAYNLLSEEEYKEMVSKIKPEIIHLYKDKSAYWAEKYSPVIGEVQDKIYDWFLKGNNISSGMENYSQVIGLLMSLEAVSDK